MKRRAAADNRLFDPAIFPQNETFHAPRSRARHTVVSARSFHKNLLQIGDRYVDTQTRRENRSVAPRRRVSALARITRARAKK